ncbi:hypothetical protein [Collinsella sp. TM09-10AT]|uniref:hypothetical protein n=1 Tax=Collinsella sp. TM09-10AT TaxID=2292343 RepID=UPI000E4337E7|nr:hypothetical protein [Collinsella sp. TM09-10AT]RGJ10396.1 hypothetical protein DXD77_05400 [Collinsella sp. TM09-10AT]
MSERLAVDSLMTADGEVVQLPTLGRLHPVDAEGGRIPLDTVKLFDAEGRFLKVESYEFSTWSQRWVVHLGSGRDAYADCCYLRRPDSFERLLEDLGEALQRDARGGHLECGYNLAVGLCCERIPEDDVCRRSHCAGYGASWMVNDIRDRIEHLCAGTVEKDRGENK